MNQTVEYIDYIYDSIELLEKIGARWGSYKGDPTHHRILMKISNAESLRTHDVLLGLSQRLDELNLTRRVGFATPGGHFSFSFVDECDAMLAKLTLSTL